MTVYGMGTRRCRYLAIETDEDPARPLSDGAWEYAKGCSFVAAAIASDQPGEPRLPTPIRQREALGLALSHLRDSEVHIVAHGVGFYRPVIGRLMPPAGRPAPDQWLDTMIMARALNLPGNLDDLWRYLYPYEAREERPPLDRAGQACWRARQVRDVFRAMRPHTATVDLMLGEVDSTINMRGFPVDPALCAEQAKACEGEMHRLEQWVREAHPSLIRPDTPGWTLACNLTVANEVMNLKEAGRAPDADRLEEARGRHHRLATAAGKWEAGAREGTSGRVRGAFAARAATSGRWAAYGLQPQNLAKTRGDHLLDTRAMVEAPRGHRLISADYGQIEMRIALKMAEAESFAESGSCSDLYRSVAASVMGTSNVTPEVRSQVKTILLGLQYGMGRAKMIDRMVEAGADAEDAARTYDAFRPLIAQYRAAWDRLEKRVAERGHQMRFAGERPFAEWVRLPRTGRRLLWHDVHEQDGRQGRERVHMVWRAGGKQWVPERVWGSKLFAHLVSATAADTLVSAVIAIEQGLIATEAEKALKARIVMHAHDEIVMVAPEAEVDATIEMMRRAMQWARTAATVLPVNFRVGDRWSEMEERL